MKSLKSQKAGNLIGYLFLIIGLGALIYAAKVSIDARGAKNWVPHYAQIENAKLETHVNDDGDKTYTIEVAYKYDWNDVSFQGNQYRLHDMATPNLADNNSVVEDLLLTKAEGGRYPIFVNPKNPRQSAVKNMVHPKAKSSSLFLGVLFTIIGFFTAFKFNPFRRRVK